MSRRLTAEEVRGVTDPGSLPFASTDELVPLDGMIGQERAVGATAFGIRMRRPGYNLFALGPARTGRTSTMRRVLAATAAAEPTPSDFCYVYNFSEPYRPVALELPAGRGRELRQEMDRLAEECRTRLPQAFESEHFEKGKAQILEELGRRQEAEMDRFGAAAREAGFTLLRTPSGPVLAPAPRGEPVSAAEFAALPERVQKELETRGAALGEQLEGVLRQLRQLEREARQAHEKLVEDVAAATVRHSFREMRDRFAGLPPVLRYLGAVEADLIAHAEEFRRLDETPALPFLPAPGAFLDRYRINVIVDRAGARGAPVVVEENPTHRNLVGRVEHRVHLGALVADFTLIRGGALQQANGGYLILEARDVLANPFAWEALKKALRSETVRIEEPLQEYTALSAGTLAPEPIPLSVKVVLIGSPLLYYLLHALDGDFGELFKVKVDFDESLPRTAENEMLYARFVAAACREEGLPAFARDGVAKLLEHASRLAGDRGRLTSRMGDLLDLVREAAFWAREQAHPLVGAEDVSRAINQRVNRANLLEERVRRLIVEGTLLVATGGEAVGQVNGISVLVAGDHAFGRPARITARTFAGEPGVVDIEREVKLGGPIHSKGVMILTGFLAGRFAQERPLALAASITFEQQYEEVEGDSASSAECYALLSSLTGIPLSQALAVTGSVNQQGEIQAVGGINEKIEGFFDVCRARGLTGGQGVLIPEANGRHLMLREDVVEAVRQGSFHVHAVATVDGGIALLTGRPAGARGPDGRFPEGSVNAAVEAALASNIARLKELKGS